MASTHLHVKFFPSNTKGTKNIRTQQQSNSNPNISSHNFLLRWVYIYIAFSFFRAYIYIYIYLKLLKIFDYINKNLENTSTWE